MSKFYKTTLVLEILSKDAPMEGDWLSDFLNSIRENSDDLLAQGEVKSWVRLSNNLVVKFVEDAGFEEDLEDRYGLDADGSEIEEEEEEEEESEEEEYQDGDVHDCCECEHGMESCGCSCHKEEAETPITAGPVTFTHDPPHPDDDDYEPDEDVDPLN